ncbi:restriction endonuclease subunit S, partial [Thiolapillus sp.]
MRSKSDKKKPLVPSLRFPEFREAGAWEVKRLGGIGSVSMCKRILKSQTSESGDIPFYKIGTFSKQADAFIENKIYEEFKEKYSFPNKGDILISASGTIGRTVVYDGKPAYFQDSNIVWIANNENILLNAFLYYCYKTIQWQTDDNTISRLYNDNLRKMKIVVPPIPEQQKIAHCLSSLDEVIGLQAKKVQALKQHKKGLMQQLFPA